METATLEVVLVDLLSSNQILPKPSVLLISSIVVFFGLFVVFSEAPDGIRLGEENSKKAS